MQQIPASSLLYAVIGNYPFYELNYPFNKNRDNPNFCCWNYTNDPYGEFTTTTNYIKFGTKEFNPNLTPWIQPPDFSFMTDTPLDEITVSVCAPIVEVLVNDSIGSVCVDITIEDIFNKEIIEKPTENGHIFIIDVDGVIIRATEETYFMLYGENWKDLQKTRIYYTESKFKFIYDLIIVGKADTFRNFFLIISNC